MAPAAPRSRPPSGILFSLPTHDLAATRDFYLRDLHLPAVGEPSGRLLIGMGAAVLEFRQHDSPPADSEDLRLTFRCPDPGTLLQRLRALGVEVDVPPPGAGVRFYARDPDGRLVAFIATTPAMAQ